MNAQSIFYFAFGISMVIALAVVIVYYYAGKRKDKVEGPKHSMMRDDD